MLTVKLLDTPKLIEDASALLYQVYIEELQWQFGVDNPSLLRVELCGKRKLLLDRFTNAAIWFGAFDDKELIGCMRLTRVDENNKFEHESYPSSQVVYKYLPHAKETCVELSKIAVQSKYAGQGVVKRMWLAVFKYCQANNLSVICCTHNGYLKNIFKRIGFPLKLEHAFKYEPHDPLPVNFYFADSEKSDVTNMIYALECLDGDLSANSSKIFQALELVVPILPLATYWHDVDGVVLGINEHCLNRIGSSREEIVGKSPYEFYPEHTAEHILSHNNQVIRSGEIMTQEEWIEDITTKAAKCFSSTKAPLYDDEGQVIGVIGSFVEITSEKEAERLKLENEAHKAAEKEQKKFKEFVEQLLHVINKYRIENQNYKLGKSQFDATDLQIELTKREKEVLYFLEQNKSPKEIASILSILDNKPIAPKTVQAVIDKQLYPKFGVYSTGELIERAHAHKLIPFLLG